MKLLFLVGTASAAAISARSVTGSFAGTSSYYLHALSDDDQSSFISSLQGFGVKVVRLWATGISQGCTKSSSVNYMPNYEDTIGDYNTDLLDAIDNTLLKLYNAGIKAIISPHDANDLPPPGSDSGYNGIDIYGETYDSDTFYTDSTAKSQYDARLASMLNYQSPNFNKSWSQLAEAILAFDLENEPMIASSDLAANNDQSDWLCGRAGNMAPIINGSGVKIATGGVGGSQYDGHEYNMIDKVLYCDAIDIISVHGYMTEESQWGEFIPSMASTAAGQGKHLMIEEWGVGTVDGEDSVATQVSLFNQDGTAVPWSYWMIIPGKSIDQECTDDDGSCCHAGLSTDPTQAFEIGVTSDRADWPSIIGAANAATPEQDWSSFF